MIEEGLSPIVWDEGETDRTLLHIAGGALVASLIGGSIGSTATGAGFASVSDWYVGTTTGY